MPSLTSPRLNFEWAPRPRLPGCLNASRAGIVGAADMPAAIACQKAGA